MGIDPYEPPASVDEKSSGVTKPGVPHPRTSPDDHLFLSLGAYACATISLLVMYSAYRRMMFPPARFMGDPELFILAAPFSLAGLGLSCLPRVRIKPLILNLISAAMIVATLAASFFFATNFPPLLR